GIVCAIFFLIFSIRAGLNFAAEWLAFGAFLIWTVFSYLGSVAPYLHRTSFFTLVQIAGMFLIIVCVSQNLKATHLLLWSFLIGCSIIAASGYVTGQYQQAELQEGERVAGLALNANTFSMLMVFAAAILLYFFKAYRSIVLKAGFAAGLLIVSLLIIASGSRTGFISFGVLVSIWVFLSYGKQIFQKPSTAITMIILFVLFGVFVAYRLRDSLLFERLIQGVFTLKGETGDTSSMERMHMFQKGLKLIGSNPLFGAGLQGFAAHYGRFSHNNVIEVFTGAGLPGGFLYYSIYLFLWFRLRRLKKWFSEPRDIDMLNLVKTFIIVRLISDMATVSYYNKASWIFIAILVGWAYHKEHEVKQQAVWYDEADDAYDAQDEMPV
ncbi:MAG: O-antigen ligase family protein, partial [Planctomycetota bacterium]